MPQAATISSIGIIMSDSSGPPPPPPVTQTREFWVLMAYAVVLGIFGAFAGLVFVGVTGFGNHWYVDSDPRWFGGHWWWIAVTAAAGVVVGVLRRLTRLPDQIPGLIEDLKDEHVNPVLVPGIAVVSAVSLIGGASLGPEKALGAIGGGAGSLLAGRRGLSPDGSKVNTLSGFAGAYGGLFSSTVIVVMLIMEAARPGGQRFSKALAGAIVASSVSFGIYFAIAGAAFVAVYQVPHFTFEDWQLGAGVLLGLFAAILVTLLAVFIQGAARLFGRLNGPQTLRSDAGRRGVRAGRRDPAADDVHRHHPAEHRPEGRRKPGRGPARGDPDREDVHVRRVPGQRLHRRPDLSHAVPGRDGRGHRPPGDPRRAAGAGVRLPARRGTRLARRRAVHDGAARRVPDPGRGAADGTRPARRDHRLPRHGRHQVLRGQPQAGSRRASGPCGPGPGGTAAPGPDRRRQAARPVPSRAARQAGRAQAMHYSCLPCGSSSPGAASTTRDACRPICRRRCACSSSRPTAPCWCTPTAAPTSR